MSSDPAFELPEIRHAPTANDTPLNIALASEFRGQRFDRCPICLAPDPTEREHLPPHALGGQVQTITCSSCNSRLGSRVEDDLVRWHRGELRVRMSNPASGVRGNRKVPHVKYRTAETGEFVLLVGQQMTADERRMMSGAEVFMDVERPNRSRVHLGALKQAYLAACLQLRAIPPIGSAAAIRDDLLAARDAADRRSVPASEIANALVVARAFTRLQVPPLAMCTFRGESVPDAVGLLLGGVVMVSWPFQDVLPRQGE